MNTCRCGASLLPEWGAYRNCPTCREADARQHRSEAGRARDARYRRADGGRRVVRVATEAAAKKLIAEGRQEAQGRTVSAAVEAYLEHKRPSVSPGTLTTLGYRLHGLLRTGERDRLLRDLKPATAAALYAKRAGETRADTHRSELAGKGG